MAELASAEQNRLSQGPLCPGDSAVCCGDLQGALVAGTMVPSVGLAHLLCPQGCPYCLSASFLSGHVTGSAPSV